MTPHWLTLSLTTLALAPRIVAICYYPNGRVTNSDVACLPGNEDSWCCGYGYACLSNKICMSTSLTPDPDASKYVRGSCTDKTWRSNNCPNFCVNPDDPNKDNTGGGEGMYLCPKTNNTFVCIDFWGSVESACASNIAVQATGTPSILTTIGFAGTTIAASSASSSTITPSSFYTATTYSHDVPNSQSFGVPLATTTPSAGRTDQNVSAEEPNKNGAAIGGAVAGGAVGLILIVIPLIFIWRRRQQRSTSNKNSSLGTPPSYDQSRRYDAQSDLQKKAMYQSPAEVYVLPAELHGTVDGRFEMPAQ